MAKKEKAKAGSPANAEESPVAAAAVLPTLVKLTDDLYWNSATGEAGKVFRAPTDEERMSLPPWLADRLLDGDLYCNSTYTFLAPLRELGGIGAGLGPATQETAARVAADLLRYLPEEVSFGGVVEHNLTAQSPAWRLQLISRADPSVSELLDAGLIAGQVIATMTLHLDQHGENARVELYPERVYPAVAVEILQMIKAKERAAQ